MSGTNEVSLMLQAAVIAFLKNQPSFTVLVGERLYDDVPEKAVFPYVTWGDDGINDDSSDCVTGSEIFFSLHIWSRAVGKPEGKRIAGVIRDLLDEEELSVVDHNLVTLNHRITRWPSEPDGLTKHGVVTFRALIDEV